MSGVASPGAAGGLPRLAWPAQGLARAVDCPQCGAGGEKPLLVTVAWHTRDNPDRCNAVLACPACGAAFYDDRTPPDYTDPNIAADGRAAFYLQQGTGLWHSAGLLARVPRPPGARYLEVGCGPGFGLDFAIHGLGWQGHGFDPSPIAEAGRKRLFLPITCDYFRGSASGAFDVLMAAEVIEHVPSPRAFLLMLRNSLAADGILVLTTPDAAAIRPQTSSGALVPLLSPGLHLILQSQASLARLLAECGFGHVTIERDSFSLIAFASRTPFALRPDRTEARARYRNWLRGRAAHFAQDPALQLAFAGHALLESVNDADFATARAVMPLLTRCLAQHFGIAIDSPLPLPAAIHRAALPAIAALMPFNLPAILYARAIMRVLEGEPRAAVRPLFAAAAEAAGALRGALAAAMLEDGETEDLAWVAAAEALLCDAETDAAGLLVGLAQLPPAPGEGPAAPSGRRRDIMRRALTGLVNKGHYTSARALVRAEALDHDTDTPLTPVARDALFALAILDSQPGGDPARARARFARVRASLEAAGATESGLYRACLNGEALATRLAGPVEPRRA